MPTYEYECKDCKHRFEQFQRITAQPLKTCPECGGTVKRLIGLGAGIIFKGSGFYCTDYKNNSSTQTSGSEKTEKSDTSSASKDSCKKCCESTDACPKK